MHRQTGIHACGVLLALALLPACAAGEWKPDGAVLDAAAEADGGGDARDLDGEGAPPDGTGDGATDGTDRADAAPAGITLVISEIDYDQPSADDREFIELYNHGSAAVACAGLTLVLVNGAASGGPASYEEIALSCSSIPAGSFFLVADDAILAESSCPGEQALSGGRIENGPDAVALVNAAREPVDQVAYGGAVAGWGEGSPAPSDPDTQAQASIQRNPPGKDTGDNMGDFQVIAATPCAAP